MSDHSDETDLSPEESHLSRRGFLGLAGAAGAGLLLPGMLPSLAQAHAVRHAAYGAAATKMVWALPQPTPSLDPFVNFSASALSASNQMYDTLLTYDSDLKLVPLLATYKAVTPTRYVYKLRPNAKFWDGSPVTAEDVAYSLARHLSPTSRIFFYFSSVKRISAPNPTTVVVTLKSPDASWRYTPVIAPIVKKSFAKPLGTNFGAPGNSPTVMASGPYVLKSFQTSSGIVMTRNPNYWGPKPSVQELEFKFITDANTRLLAMQAGQIDATFGVPVSRAEEWKSIPGVTLFATPGFSTYYMSFDFETPPYRDIHIRRAFAHAFDRQGVVKSILKGYGAPATAFVPPSMWRGIADKDYVTKLYRSLPKYTYDLSKAKAELAKSTRPNGFNAVVRVPSTISDLISALQVLGNGLKQIGVNLLIVTVPPPEWIAYMSAHKNLNLESVSIVPDYPDPVNYFSVAFNSANAVVNGRNLANYKNNTVDKLLKLQAETTDDALRAKYISTILRHTVKEIPYLPLWWQNELLAIRNTFTYSGFTGMFFRQQWSKGVKSK